MSSMASTTEGAFSFSVAEVVEDVLQQHGSRVRGLDLESRKAEEAGIFFFLFFFFFFILFFSFLVSFSQHPNSEKSLSLC